MNESDTGFTPHARRALALARKEADRFHHSYVGTEHLLLGVINLGQGVAVNVFKKIGLDLEVLRVAVGEQVGPAVKPTGSVPYTPRVKKVLALAQKEAKAFGQSSIGTEHILLGLLREGNGVAARVLKGFNLDLEHCRREIIAEMPPASTEMGSGPDWDGVKLPAWENTAMSPEFSQNAVLALARARREADWFHLATVLPEHILLGILSQTGDMALVLLTKMGVDPATLRAELFKELTPGAEPVPRDKLVFSPPAAQVIEKAKAEAVSFNHLEVEPKHLLLGLTSGGEGLAAKFLSKFQIEYKVLRDLCAKV